MCEVATMLWLDQQSRAAASRTTRGQGGGRMLPAAHLQLRIQPGVVLSALSGLPSCTKLKVHSGLESMCFTS